MPTKKFKDLEGYTSVTYSKSLRSKKKWCATNPENKKLVCWGDPTMQDYTQHGDKKRRYSFRKRMSGIRLKDGTRAIDKRYSPAWAAYYVTW